MAHKQHHGKLADPRIGGQYALVQRNKGHFGKELRRRRRRNWLAKLSRRTNRAR